MADFDEELAVLRADVVAPDAAATERISARSSRSVGELALSGMKEVSDSARERLLAADLVPQNSGLSAKFLFQPDDGIQSVEPQSPVPISSPSRCRGELTLIRTVLG